MSIIPLVTIPFGIVVERCKSAGPWADFLWRPVSLLAGMPETPPWTKLSDDGERATFYAGKASVELYRSEASNYRENLLVEVPALWVALPSAEGDPPFGAPAMTADPAEGEAWAGTSDVIVESLPMPDAVRAIVADFVAEHHVERAFSKRQRDRADPEAMAKRMPQEHDGKP